MSVSRFIKLRNSIVSTLAGLIESRDKSTGKHVERTTGYLKILLYAMRERKVYDKEMEKWDLDAVVSSARLHDIGKINVSDLILNKPGVLTFDEMAKMKTHTSYGESVIEGMIAESGDDEDYLLNAKLFAGGHHEKWNGTGYPKGLKGEEIPLQGRALALVDVYDALTTPRSYKEAFTHEKAKQIIFESKEVHFDPKIVDVFLEVNDKFEEMNQKWKTN